MSELGLHLDGKIDQLRAEIVALVAANDVRYQQRFDAQGKALDAAFGAAKEAVNAALAASDKAAVKTELSADKRFADLGDLIREQFKGMGQSTEALSLRITSVENRLNLSVGEGEGVRHTKDDSKAMWAIGISIAVAVMTLIAMLFKNIGGK